MIKEAYVSFETAVKDNPVDACYKMILNLYEQNLLCLWKNY